MRSPASHIWGGSAGGDSPRKSMVLHGVCHGARRDGVALLGPVAILAENDRRAARGTLGAEGRAQVHQGDAVPIGDLGQALIGGARAEAPAGLVAVAQLAEPEIVVGLPL